MSNVALFSNSNVPAFAKKAEVSSIVKALAGGGGGSGGFGKRISIKGGVFRLLVDGKEVAAVDERFLDVVIVNAAPKVGRTFYASSFNPENPGAPDCWSADGEKPDANAANPQSSRCADCPQNVAGSGTGNSRACRYSQRLAVVLENEIEGSVMQLQIPATSIFGKEDGENRPLQAYARFLMAQNVSPEMVVTRMKFDTKSESPKLFFKPMRWLTEEEYETVVRQGATEDAKRAVTMTVSQTDKAAPLKLEGKPPTKAKVEDEEEAPAPKAKKAKPKVEEDEDVEPTVRKEEKPSSTRASLAKVAAQWDDE